jgi:hypothetical protein
LSYQLVGRIEDAIALEKRGGKPGGSQ